MNDPTLGPPESKDAGKPFSWSAAPRDGRSIWDTRGQPPIHDPFLHAPPAPPPRSPWLAIVAATSTFLFLATSALAVWLWRRPLSSPLDEPAAPAPTQSRPQAPPADDPDPPPRVPAFPAPSPSSSAAAADAVPRQTKASNVGRIEVVDVGVDNQKSLRDLLGEQRTIAKSGSRTLLLMTTRYDSSLFRDVDAALRDPLLQSALADVRLVRVDSRFFEVELDEMGIPTESHPWFLLLGADLSPRDGIHGGEWDDDIPRNIAPVLGPFVRGTYKQRRELWKPPPGKGVQL